MGWGNSPRGLRGEAQLRILRRCRDTLMVMSVVKEALPADREVFIDALRALAPDKPPPHNHDGADSVIFIGLVLALSRANTRELTPILLSYAAIDPLHRTVVEGLATLGDHRAIPVVQKALECDDESVRDAAVMGISISAEHRFGDQKFLQHSFDLVARSLASPKRLDVRRACEALLRLDHARASVLLTATSMVTSSNQDLGSVLDALRDARVRLPPDLTRSVLDELKRVPETYWTLSATQELLLALARTSPHDAIERATAYLDHPDQRTRQAASEAIALAHGLRGPLFECTSAELEQLGQPAKLMIHIGEAMFQIEANGLSALFCNWGPGEWRGAVDAFNAIGAVESASIIEEYAKYWTSERRRLDRGPGLQEDATEAEERLEKQWWLDNDRRDRLMLQFVLRHKEHFQLPDDEQG
ncbi:MAG: DUF4375 domain-containing protein [Phycisphaerales bacterium]|nr:DUF4375 domain-containing protein [Phycisphaerales bacterium]